MTDIRPAWKEWARHLRSTIPGRVEVNRFCDEPETTSIDILTSTNDEGVVAATIGIMEINQSKKAKKRIFTEILMDVRGENATIGNILSTIGFYIIKDGWRVMPGTVFEKMVSMYLPDLAVRHVVFAPPFQWDDGMTAVSVTGKTIHPLLAIPITDGERRSIKRRGFDALEGKWEEAGTDVLDWHRDGVV